MGVHEVGVQRQLALPRLMVGYVTVKYQAFQSHGSVPACPFVNDRT